MSGFQLFRCDRVGRDGSGVALFISNSLKVKIITTSGGIYVKKPEFIFAEISTDCERFLLAVAYQPLYCYLMDFFYAFSNLSASYKHTIIFGDFNANLLTKNFDSDQIRNFIDYFALYLMPYAPTHHTSSATFLDLCIVDDREKLISFNQRNVCFLSSHDLIEITYNILVCRRDVRTIIVRDYSNFIWNTFSLSFSVTIGVLSQISML